VGFWSAPVWLVLFLVGQGWSRDCAYAVAGFGFACLVLASYCMHLMHEALTKRFGFRITWRNAPPYRYRAFGEWCRRNGVDAADERSAAIERPRNPAAHLAPSRAHSARSRSRRVSCAASPEDGI
jgi:hypothetical protein